MSGPNTTCRGSATSHGDGKADVLWRHDSGQIVLWQMDGDKIVSNTQILDVSNQYHVQDVRDYNGDGKSDVLLRHDSGQVVLWQMDGDHIAGNVAIATVGNDAVIQAHHFDLRASATATRRRCAGGGQQPRLPDDPRALIRVHMVSLHYGWGS